jgi:hypothetical protein
MIYAQAIKAFSILEIFLKYTSHDNFATAISQLHLPSPANSFIKKQMDLPLNYSGKCQLCIL